MALAKKALSVLASALGLAGASVVMSGGPAFFQAPAFGKVEPAVMADTANGGTGSFFVLLNDQADLTELSRISDNKVRSNLIYQALTHKATADQRSLRSVLDARGVRYQPFWVGNFIVVQNGDRSLVQELAGRPDVRLLESNHHVGGISQIEPPEIAQGTDTTEQPPVGPEWGLLNIHAPDVWAQGFTGQGIVIGDADTGQQWDHPALISHYRGYDPETQTVDHNYSWHDSIHNAIGNPCPNDSPAPCDDNAHGTHTAGTTVGDDGAGNQIGVAPGAKWIGCRNMDRGDGQPSRYAECFQWFIAPTDLNGQNPRPDLHPDVINNSWGCPGTEGCAPNSLLTVVNNTQNARIFVEVSNGNSGPNCHSTNDPPAIYANSFSSGAYDINNNLASFSSRGPVQVDFSNRRKPDISGPGVSVRSSIPTNNYANFSGTSMAGPHVVGTVALLWSADPSLYNNPSRVTLTKTILQNTANPTVNVLSGPTTCGTTSTTQIPNNFFGYGRVDAIAAVCSRITCT